MAKTRDMIASTKPHNKTGLVVELKERGGKLIAEVHGLNDNIRKLKEDFAKIIGKLVRYARVAYLDGVKTENRPHVILTDGDNKITFTWKHQYGKIPFTMMDDLKRIAKSHLDILFKKRKRVQLREGMVNDDAFMKRLTKLCGGDLATRFDVDEWIEPTQTYTSSRHTILSRDDNKKLDEFVVQRNPTVGLK